MSGEHRFLALAVITGAHGIKGEVKCLPYSRNPEDLRDYSLLVSQNGQSLPCHMSGMVKQQAILRLDGINTRNQAELLKGTELGIWREELPETEQDSYYVADLIGLSVVAENGNAFGIIIALHDFGAGDIVEIKTTDGAKELFSFTAQNFGDIDEENRTITIFPPEIQQAERS